MRTKKIHVIGMLIGSCFIAGVAGAMPAIPGQPPAGTPAALPSGPVPAPEPSPTDPPTGGSGDGLLNLDLEAASAYVWRGINVFGEDQNSQAFSVFPSITATFGALSLGYWGAFQLSGDNKSALATGSTRTSRTRPC